MQRPLVMLAALFAAILAGAGALTYFSDRQTQQTAPAQGDIPVETEKDLAKGPAREDAAASAPEPAVDRPAAPEVETAAAEPEPGEADGPSPGPASDAAPEADAAGSPPTDPSFDIVRLEPTGDALIAGRASPGAQIEVVLDGEVVATTTADAEGAFVTIPAKPFSPGQHQLSLRVAGATAPASPEQIVAIRVPEAGQGTAEIISSEQQIAAADAGAAGLPEPPAPESGAPSGPEAAVEAGAPVAGSPDGEPAGAAEAPEEPGAAEQDVAALTPEPGEGGVSPEASAPGAGSEAAGAAPGLDSAPQTAPASPGETPQSAAPSAEAGPAPPAGEVAQDQPAEARAPDGAAPGEAVQPGSAQPATGAAPEGTSEGIAAGPTPAGEAGERPEAASAGEVQGIAGALPGEDDGGAASEGTETAAGQDRAPAAGPDTEAAPDAATGTPPQEERPADALDQEGVEIAGAAEAEPPEPQAGSAGAADAQPGAQAPEGEPRPDEAAATASAGAAEPGLSQSEGELPALDYPNTAPSFDVAGVAPGPEEAGSTPVAPGAGADRTAGSSTTEAPTTGAPTTEASTPEAEAPPPVLSIRAAEAEARNLYVAGEAAPGAVVRVYAGEEFVGEAEATEHGTWLVEAAKQIPLGNITLRADVAGATATTPAAQVEAPFTRFADGVVLEPTAAVVAEADSTAAVQAPGPQPTFVIIRRGDNLWRISRRKYGRGIRYEAIFAANRDLIRNPNLIYPGQAFILPERDRSWEAQIN